MPTNNKNNGKVNLAIINTKLEYIQDDINDMKKVFEENSKRIVNNQNNIARLETKTNAITIFQSGLTVVASALAAFLGVRK